MAETSVIDFRVRLPEALRPATQAPPDLLSQYDAVLGLGSKLGKDFETLRREMDEHGVGHAVVHAEYEFGDPADDLNDAVARIVADEPGRFSGVGTVSLAPLDIMRALGQIDRIADAGLKGVSIQPAFFNLPTDDRRLYPVYAKAAERGLFVALHSGVNYARRHPMEHDHPLLLDRVASDFPGLTLIACHAGWPWSAEMVAVARRHPTVMLEFGGLAPKYVGAENSGWGVVFRFMNSVLRDQVLFGTDWPVIDQGRALGEWRALGLRDAVLEKLLSGNAARLLGR